MDHNAALAVCYAAALLGWWTVARRRRDLWPAGAAVAIARPWFELLLAVLAVLAILAIGQLYIRGIKLPVAQGGASAVLAESCNQLLIFSPVLLLVLLRRQSRATLLVPDNRLPLRIAFGFGLGAAAVVVYALVRKNAPAPLDALAAVYDPVHVTKLVEVTMEDLAIALLAVRATAALGPGWLVPAIVGVLFAAGHVPTMLSLGVRVEEMAWLLRDAALATVVIRVLLWARDVTWFFGLHFAMDMTQRLVA
jgi:hypothetical protein